MPPREIAILLAALLSASPAPVSTTHSSSVAGLMMTPVAPGRARLLIAIPSHWVIAPALPWKVDVMTLDEL